MKLDILAFGAHPDDVELAAGGTLLSHLAQGKKVGIIDLTRGELGTRGNAEIRLQEAEEAANILGINVRDNLAFADGFFANDATHQLAVIRKIRQYQPTIVLANALEDRHPDHARGAQLIADACFLSGLRKITTLNERGRAQAPHRPKAVYHYLQNTYYKPDFVVDITEFMDKKMKAIAAYKSQFFHENSNESDEPQTYISTPYFVKHISNRASEIGMQAGLAYSEGFTMSRVFGIKSLFDLI